MKTRKYLASIPLVMALSAYGSDLALLRLEKKEVYVGFDSASFESRPQQFDVSRLEELAEGKDIIPGMPEEGAMCAKFMRATLNTLLGSEFFRHHRLHSKIATNLLGIETLPADQYGLTGDAWDMYHNIQKAGGEVVYRTENPVQDNKKSIDFLANNAKLGDILGFYYPDSQYNNTARNAGAGFTHMGMVVGFDNSSKPIIFHLFHSQNYMEDVPAVRNETMDNIQRNLTFSKYIQPLDFQKSPEEHNYKEGDPLLFIRTIIRPAYNIGQPKK